MKERLRAIRNKFILLGIKAKGFCKNHKIASGALALLLVSAIVVSVLVRAATTWDTATVNVSQIELAEPNVSDADAFDADGRAYNFSTVYYNIDYDLKNSSGTNLCTSPTDTYYVDDVTIEAKLGTTDNAIWNETDETTVSTLSDDKKTLTVHVANVQACTGQQQVLSLTVLNSAKPGVTGRITPTIKIKGGSATAALSTISGVPSVTTVATDEVELTANVQAGIAKSDGTGKRLGKFGIALGISGGTDAESYASLKGKYIKNADEIFMYADYGSASVSLQTGTNSTAEVASSNNVFGAYTEGKKLFSPLMVPEVSTSGYAKSVEETSEESTDQYSVVFYGVEPLTFDTTTSSVEALIDNTYVVENGHSFQCAIGGSERCSIQNIPNQSSTAREGYILYTYGSEGDTYEYKRKYKIVSSDTQYYGPKSIEVTKADAASLIAPIATINDVPAVVCKKSGTTTCSGSYEIGNLTVGDYELRDGTNTITAISVKENIQDLTADNITVPLRLTISKRDSYNLCKDNLGFDTCTGGGGTFNPSVVGSSIAYITVEKTWGDGSSLNGNTYKVDYKQQITVTKTLYKLSINNIAYNGSLTKIDASNFYAVGTYFVTTAGVTESSNELCLTAFTKSETNKTNKCINVGTTFNGSNTPYNRVYVLEDGDYVRATNSDTNYYTAAMGEEIEQELVFEYGYDATSNITELVANAPFNKDFLQPTAYNDTIEGDTPINQNFAFIDVLNEDISGSSSNPATTLTYQVIYVNSSTGAEYAPENLPSGAVVDKIKVKVTPTSGGTGIEPGTNIRIRLKYIVKSMDQAAYEAKSTTGTNVFNFATNTFDCKTAATTNNVFNQTFPTSANVYVTPYKLRFNSKFGKKDSETQEPVLKDIDELTFDASKNDTYTMAVFPDVISPTLDVSSAAFGYSAVESIPLVVTLPKGVSYVYNEKYKDVVPKVTYNSDGTTTLSYTYYGVEPNSWIEPLQFDFNIDVNASTSHASTSTSPYKIKVEIGGSNKTSIMSDYSASNYKIAFYPLSIENTYDVAYGQYLYNTASSDTRHYISNVDVNENFVHTMKLKNNKDTAANNVYAYAVLPNPKNSNITNYNGTFEVDIPSLSSVSSTGIDEIKCAYSVDGLTNSDVAMASTTWTNCDGSNENLSGYRIHYASIAADAEKEFSVTYTVKDNSAADIYEFHSYVVYNSASTYISMHPVALEVISKKIKGYVFEDFVVNGIWDDSERPIEGVVLKLYGSDNNLVKTTTSNKDGLYVFSGLSEGSYYVVAEFNNEKYGLTTVPSNDYYDKSKISVFKEDTSTTDTGTTTINGIKTDEIKITSETRVYDYVNLGLTPRKTFKAKINKYVSRAIVTDALGVQTKKDFNNAKIAKLDVKNLDKVKIKVIYTLEIQNTMYYPGYVKKITEMVPAGMTFNKEYSENKGWTLLEDGTLENTSLAGVALKENEKKYIKVAFDITSKEAGSFVNIASIDELQILGGATDE